MPNPKADIPPLQHPIWKFLLTGEKQIPLHFLAAKMMLGRAKNEIKKHPTMTFRLTSELHGLFLKNINLPSVQRDLEQLSLIISSTPSHQ